MPRTNSATLRISHHDKISASTALGILAKWMKEHTIDLIPASIIDLAKKLGIAGIALTAANEALVAAAPGYYEPAYNFVTELVGWHPEYSVVSNEPNMTADGQGHIAHRTKYFYDVRVSDLTVMGIVTGRFRGAAQPGIDEDHEWWPIRGYSDGTKAKLAYTDEEGNILGQIEVTTKDEGVTWSGTLTGKDLSLGEVVQSPIMIGHNPYETKHRLYDDKFLDQASVIVSQ